MVVRKKSNDVTIGEINESGLLFNNISEAMYKATADMPQHQKGNMYAAMKVYTDNFKEISENLDKDIKSMGRAAAIKKAQEECRKADKLLVNNLTGFGLVDTLVAAEQNLAKVPWKDIIFPYIADKRAVQVLKDHGYDFNTKQYVDDKWLTLPQVWLAKEKNLVLKASQYEKDVVDLFNKSGAFAVKSLYDAYQKETNETTKNVLNRDLTLAHIIFSRNCDSLLKAVNAEDGLLQDYRDMEEARKEAIQSGVFTPEINAIAKNQVFDTLKSYAAKNERYTEHMIQYIQQLPKPWTKEEIQQKKKEWNFDEGIIERFEEHLKKNFSTSSLRSNNSTLASHCELSNQDIPLSAHESVGAFVQNLHLPTNQKTLGQPVNEAELESRIAFNQNVK